MILAAAFPLAAAEAAHEGGSELPWQVANFVVLAGGLGYLIYKHAGKFFSNRTADIRQGIEEAAKVKAGAEARYADMEKRLSRLGAEIESLRAEATRETQAEGERMREETAREIANIQAQSAQEIESAGKAARHQLRAYAAGLAVSLAERKIREQLTPDADKTLLNAMLKDLEGRSGAPDVRAS
jgi:F-type H+-transporting ATPase subunit b